MKETSFRLAAGGVWKENIPVKLERGARVYGEWGLAFSESGTFAIIRQRENGNLDMVEIGGKKRLVSNHQPVYEGISQKFGIGTYFDDKEPDFRYSEKEIADAIAVAEDEAIRLENERIEAERKDKETKEKLLKEYDFLERAEPYCGEKVAAKNLRALLKKKFPKQKFSVAKSGGAYYVTWTDGVAMTEVEKVTKMFSGGYFDGMTDMWQEVKNLFGELFGTIDYCFEQREISDELRNRVFEEYTAENNFNLEDKTTLECVWRDVRKRINETSY